VNPWKSKYRECSCFARVEHGALLDLTPSPRVEGVWNATFEFCKGVVITQPILEYPRVILYTNATLEPCRLHNCPSLATPGELEKIAIRLANSPVDGGGPGGLQEACESNGVDSAIATSTCEGLCGDCGTFPIFAQFDGERVDYRTEPLKGFHQVGVIRGPYIYVMGDGGFLMDSPAVDFAVTEYLKEEFKWPMNMMTIR
jgi:hypothetical protein